MSEILEKLQHRETWEKISKEVIDNITSNKDWIYFFISSDKVIEKLSLGELPEKLTIREFRFPGRLEVTICLFYRDLIIDYKVNYDDCKKETVQFYINENLGKLDSFDCFQAKEREYQHKLDCKITEIDDLIKKLETVRELNKKIKESKGEN